MSTPTRFTSAVALSGVVAATLAIGACGSSHTPPARTSSSRASKSHAQDVAATAGAASTASTSHRATLTKPGSTLQVGQTAHVQYSETTHSGKTVNYPFTITVSSIKAGSMNDFKDVSLTGVPKGATPTYVSVTITNVGHVTFHTGEGDPGYAMGAVEPDGLADALSLTGDFPPCPQTDVPAAYLPGQPLHTCQIYLVRGAVKQVGYDGSESTIDSPVVWSTGASA